ncbi:MAG TPA: hypothetical protein PLZ51_14485, partial [Aggregatilineales bacterium]|nr:hypothetical protein [Aggregatilineales bacterium]
TLAYEGHIWDVKGVFYSPDGQFISVGFSEGTVQILNAQTGENALTLERPSGSITSSAVYSPDGQFIVAGLDDDTVRIWDTQRGINRAILIGHGDDVTSVAYSPDGQFIASGGEDKTILV